MIKINLKIKYNDCFRTELAIHAYEGSKGVDFTIDYKPNETVDELQIRALEKAKELLKLPKAKHNYSNEKSI